MILRDVSGRFFAFPLRLRCVFVVLKEYSETVDYAQVDDAPMGARVDRMSGEQRRYASYLLRLWQVQSKGRLVWRASLEHSSTGERRAFASLADLYAFLGQVTASVDEDKSCSNPGGCGEDGRGVE